MLRGSAQRCGPGWADAPARVETLVVTAQFAPSMQMRLDALRERHFPPGLNRVPAHISLFHRLPGERLDGLVAETGALLAHSDPAARFAGVRFLGRGVALEVAAPGLVAVRAALAARWREHLIPQDRQPFRPHVTVQNKVEPAAARALAERMRATFVSEDCTPEAVVAWWYRAGDWAEAARVGWARLGQAGG